MSKNKELGACTTTTTNDSLLRKTLDLIETLLTKIKNQNAHKILMQIRTTLQSRERMLAPHELEALHTNLEAMHIIIQQQIDWHGQNHQQIPIIPQMPFLETSPLQLLILQCLFRMSRLTIELLETFRWLMTQAQLIKLRELSQNHHPLTIEQRFQLNLLLISVQHKAFNDVINILATSVSYHSTINAAISTEIQQLWLKVTSADTEIRNILSVTQALEQLQSRYLHLQSDYPSNSEAEIAFWNFSLNLWSEVRKYCAEKSKSAPNTFLLLWDYIWESQLDIQNLYTAHHAQPQSHAQVDQAEDDTEVLVIDESNSTTTQTDLIGQLAPLTNTSLFFDLDRFSM